MELQDLQDLKIHDARSMSNHDALRGNIGASYRQTFHRSHLQLPARRATWARTQGRTSAHGPHTKRPLDRVVLTPYNTTIGRDSGQVTSVVRHGTACSAVSLI